MRNNFFNVTKAAVDVTHLMTALSGQGQALRLGESTGKPEIGSSWTR